MPLAPATLGSYGADDAGKNRESLMAKKARKKSAARGMKKSKKKSRPAPKKKKNIRKRRAKSTGKMFRAYRTVVDTFKGTDKLRNKMEQPGTSESE